MKVIEKKITDLIPYENNPRINDRAVDAVAASIREFGFKVPIICDAHCVIVGGHTRLKAAEKLGLDKVPVIIADDLTEEQIREFRIIDNKSQELADWDLQAMKDELASISGIDMAEFGFLLDDIEKVNESEAKKREQKETEKAEEIYCPRCGAVVGVK